MKEVGLGRYAGLFKEVPYPNYIQSPIGLVPKDGGKKTRLIFHLSYDFNHENGESLNHYTPDEICSVKYKDLEYAVQMSLNLLKDTEAAGNDEQTIFYAKTDLTSAFRILPLSPECYCWLVMKAQDPIMGKWWFFIDKCLPFGSSRSCALFQEFSDALQFLVEFKTRRPNTVSNYLDDFLFAALTRLICNHMVQAFLDICEEINCPVSDEKTMWATEIIIFLGILLDG